MKIDPSLTRIAAGMAADRVARQRVEDADGKVAAENARTANADAAVLSAEARDVRLAQRLLSQAPDIRQDRVADLKRLIEAGEYEVDARRVADKLIEGGLR